MRKSVVLAALMLLLGTGVMAQTIDLTTVTINTERAKKEYVGRKYVVLTGSFRYPFGKEISGTPYNGAIGARFGMVKHFGFYAGFEIGLHGLPFGSYVDSPSYNYGETPGYIDTDGSHHPDKDTYRYPMFSFVGGGILNVSYGLDIFAGTGITMGNEIFKYPKGDRYDATYEWSKGKYVSPVVELGLFYHIGHFTGMVSASYIPVKFKGLQATLGFGYNF